MASLAANPAQDNLKGPLSISLVMHAALAVLFIGSAMFSQQGEGWGGPGGAITVGVVGSLPAVPMPRPAVETPSRVVDESKGLYKAEPQPKPVVPPDATPIPKFEKKKPPKYVTRPSKVLENPAPASAKRCAVRRWRDADGAVHLVCDGLGNFNAGGDGFRWARGGKFRGPVFVVRGSGATEGERGLAAIHGGSENQFCAAGGGDVRYFAEWDGDEHSGDAVERKSLGGFVGGAGDTRCQPDAAVARGLFGGQG